MRRPEPPPRPNAPTPDELLAGYPPEIRRIADRVREVVHAAVPTLTERALPGWRAIAFRDPHAGHVGALFPQRHEVQLYLEHGARLPDPDGLLLGAATMMRGRYVRFRTVRDVRVRALTRLMRIAVVRQSL